ncbi:MAG: hypothetical protein R3232_01430 [Clostridia bacterium]|nr:hypothetical protein [Clostridia bacterium]
MIYVNIEKENKKGFRWSETNGIYVCGYGYINGEYHEGLELTEYFSGISDFDDFTNRVMKLNGLFSVIIDKGESVFAAVDRYGVFRLFYHQDHSGFYIGDDTAAIVEKTGLNKINKEAETDWVYSGFPSGNETLIEGLHSLNASLSLFYNSIDHSLKIDRYHDFTQEPDDKKYEELISGLNEVFKNAGERFVRSLDGKKAIIPLSGGVDSRFGSLMLFKAGYKNVLCVTYGNPGDKEERMAAEVAGAYGFEHMFIPYIRSAWRGLFKDSENIRYIDYASKYKTTPHFSDLFAARQLSKILNPEECVVVPGHVGSIAESKMKTDRYYKSSELVRAFIIKYFYYYGLKCPGVKNHLNKRLDGYFRVGGEIDAYASQSLFDRAGYDTYRSTHLFMATKPYEFYGFKFRLPLMDNEVVDFFKTVPLNHKGHSKKILTDFVTGGCQDDPGIYDVPNKFAYKVIRNLRDKRYNCINPFDVFKLRKPEYGLPGIHRTLYRYYRNYLSYAAAKTLQYILNGLENEQN